MPESSLPAQENIQPTTPPIPIARPNNWLLIGLGLLLLFSLGSIGFLFYQNNQLKKQIAQLQVKPTPTIPQPTPTTDPTADWKTYLYKESDFKSNSPEIPDYEYQGKITFKHPFSYKFYEGTCRSYYHEDKGLFCVNIGGLALSKEGEVELTRFLELFDLKNEDHLKEFELTTSNHNVISEENIGGYKHIVKKLEIEMDTAPSVGYETKATVYNVNTNLVGFRFTLAEDEGISRPELKTIEEEILQIIQTIETE